MQELKALVNEIPDFPKPGILFRDITPLLRSRFDATIDALEELFTEAEWASVDAVAGIESRGFILAAALAERRHKGFVAIRKKGKLPPPVVDVSYDLEYGSGVLEMQTGRGGLLLIDDVARHGRHARRLGRARAGRGLRAARRRGAARHRHRARLPLAAGSSRARCCATTDRPMTEPRPQAGRPAALAFIFVTIVLDMFALGLVVPVLPHLVEDFVGGDTAGAARVYGVFGTVWALMQFVSMR